MAVDREDALPLLIRDISRAKRVAADAGAADEHVEPSELRLDASDPGFDLVRPGDVRSDGEAAGPELPRGGLGGIGAQIEDGYPVRRSSSIALGDRAPDAARTARHERHAPGEVVGDHRRLVYQNVAAQRAVSPRR